MGLRDPDGGGRDDTVLIYVRRAKLDSFWSRKPSTLYKYLLGIRSVIKDTYNMGMTSSLPERGFMVLGDIS